MCLLFFQIKNHAQQDAYKLILVSVRDEIYTRPTHPARFWTDNPSIIGGQDAAEGSSGGTWLAMNKDNGRIGVLLNITQPDSEVKVDKISRGFIVNDYLTGDLSHQDYLKQLSQRRSDYNGFRTIALEVGTTGVSAGYYSNLGNTPIVLQEGIHSFGNSISHLDPWSKVTYGQHKFQKLISNHQNTETKDQLIDDLFNMMKDKTLIPVDENMRNQKKGTPDNILTRLSSLCVEMPEDMYGSRYEFFTKYLTQILTHLFFFPFLYFRL